MSIRHRIRPFALTLVFALLLAGPARPEGNVAGSAEERALQGALVVLDEIDDMDAVIAGRLENDGGPTVGDVGLTLDDFRGLEFDVGVLEKTILHLAEDEHQDSTNVQPAHQRVRLVTEDLGVAVDGLEKLDARRDSSSAKERTVKLTRLRDLLARYRAEIVRAAFDLMGMAPTSRGELSPETFVGSPGRLVYWIAFDMKTQRHFEKILRWILDATDLTPKARKARSTILGGPVVGKKAGKKAGKKGRTRYLSFRAKNKRAVDAFGFLDLNREFRGPFVWGFTAGVFKDHPKPDLYRGQTFVGMEVSNRDAATPDTFSVNVRYVVRDEAGDDVGVQVFAQSPVGPVGSLFLPGVQLVEVRTEYDGSRFTVSAKPFGAPDSAFLEVAVYEHGGLDVVWLAGVGGANFNGKTELGVDDIYFREVGEGDGGGGGGGGGESAPTAYSGSFVVDGEANTSGAGTFRYTEATGRLTIELLAGGPTIRITLEGVDGPGLYDPDPLTTHYQEGSPIVTTYRFLEGTGQVEITYFDPATKTCRANFAFETRHPDFAQIRKNVTNGRCETNKMIVN